MDETLRPVDAANLGTPVKTNGHGHTGAEQASDAKLRPISRESKWAAESFSKSKGRPMPGADTISGFVESLVKKAIVSREDVQEAILRKRVTGDGDRRQLFQVLIENQL